MAEDRFSPVNEVADISSPSVSPGRLDCGIQSDEEPAENSQVKEEPIGQEPTNSEDYQPSSEIDQSVQDTAEILKEDDSTVITKHAEPNTAESLNITAETPREQEACIHCHLPLNCSELETTRSNQTETKITSGIEEVEYSKPIPLPKQGISYISTRNYLTEQGLEVGPKPSHEKRTYIIGGPANPGRPHELSDYSGLVPELAKPGNTHITPGAAHLTYKTVGPILQKSPHYKHSYNMSLYHHPTSFPSGFSRSQERDELHHLNDRFSVYVQTVRRLGEEFSQLDSSSFLHSCKVLEEQMENLKNLYEKELESLRKQLDDSIKDKNQLRRTSEKHQQAAANLQNRLTEECERSSRLMNEVTETRRRLSLLESEMSEIRTAQQNQVHVQQMSSHIDGLTRENRALRESLEKQQQICDDLQEKTRQLEGKLSFNGQISQSSIGEMRERLEVANNNILTLESRLREQGGAGTNLGDMLTKVREAAAAELQKYQAESEERFNRNMAAVRAQVEEDARRIDSLRTQNEEFLQRRADFEAQIKSLQQRLSNSENACRLLKETMASERNRYANQISGMERKARELQALLMDKMHEANMAREMQLPLKAEIEAFKVLLEDEEKRLRYPVQEGFVHTNGVSTSTTLRNAAYPQCTIASVYTTSAGDSALVPSAPPRSPVPFKSELPVPTCATANVYTYQTSPSINQLNLESTSQSGGTLASRVRSAPAAVKTSTCVSFPASRSRPVSSRLGQGRDYFQEMFPTGKTRPPQMPQRPHSTPITKSASHDYNTCTTSATGDLKVLEVHQDGRYVRLMNTGSQDAEIGGYMIQQNVGGHPVAVYRFSPHTRLPSQKTVTVWCGTSDPMLHQPPTDFVWKEHEKWGTGPECTTILCKPNGQAIAWTTAAHRFTHNKFEEESRSSTTEPHIQENGAGHEVMTETYINGTAIPSDSVYLRREKQSPPSLSPTKHPHGTFPGKRTHPQACPQRPLTAGNDNSSLNRQSRSQTCTPDPTPGQPYAGPSGQRIGYYAPPPGIPVHSSGKIANKATNPGVTSMPPSAFMTPRDRFSVGLQQVQSQHHDYNAPMPRPPLYSAW